MALIHYWKLEFLSNNMYVSMLSCYFTKSQSTEYNRHTQKAFSFIFIRECLWKNIRYCWKFIFFICNGYIPLANVIMESTVFSYHLQWYIFYQLHKCNRSRGFSNPTNILYIVKIIILYKAFQKLIVTFCEVGLQ